MRSAFARGLATTARSVVRLHTVATGQTPATVVEDWHTVGEPGEPGYGFGWEADPGPSVPTGLASPPAEFFRDTSGFVYLRGMVVQTDPAANGGTVFTLPVGWRPEALRWTMCMFGQIGTYPNADYAALLSVYSSGEVAMTLPNWRQDGVFYQCYLTLDSPPFRAA